jgi:hypothetical protein
MRALLLAAHMGEAPSAQAPISDTQPTAPETTMVAPSAESVEDDSTSTQSSPPFRYRGIRYWPAVPVRSPRTFHTTIDASEITAEVVARRVCGAIVGWDEHLHAYSRIPKAGSTEAPNPFQFYSCTKTGSICQPQFWAIVRDIFIVTVRLAKCLKRCNGSGISFWFKVKDVRFELAIIK